MALIRIDKLLADAGKGTRSEIRALLKRGQVCVDGETVKSADFKLDPQKSGVTLSGVPVEYKKHRYIMMNKPAGYVSATEDNFDKTVIELLDEDDRKRALYPAGRLDKDTEGLLILTDDGDFCHRIISPKEKVEKIYYAKISAPLTEKDVAAFRSGIRLRDGYLCKSASLELLEDNAVLVTLTEGKYHQVRRMLASRGVQVEYLKRIKIGGLKLDESISPGGYRDLTMGEIDSIFNQ